MQVEDDIFDRTDADYLVLELDNIMVPFFIEEYYFKTDTTALIKFEGIDSLERAKEFANIDVYFPRNIKDNSIDSEEETLSYPMLVGFQVNEINK